jgi:hypothetical protein
VFPDERFQWLQARGIHALDPIGARMRSRAPRLSKPIIPNGRVVTPAPPPPHLAVISRESARPPPRAERFLLLSVVPRGVRTMMGR